MQTADMAVNNIEMLGQLFPNCLTETKNAEGKVVQAIDFDKLRQELACEVVEGAEERYQFTWPDKRAAIRKANEPINKTLRPCREESVDFDNTENLYIEGDNLEVLKLLRENYLGKVKMIYIDPPYNTGNDFVYNDNFAMTTAEFSGQSGLFDEEGNRMVDPMVQNTESNGRFHTDWLNMIYPRLKVARDLLSDDGIIIISINDIEVKNLRAICDEIFGRENCLSQMVWKNKYGAGGGTNGIAMVHEYLMVYSKNIIESITCELSEELKASYTGKDEYYETRGGYVTQPLASTSKGERVNLMYSFEHNGEIVSPPKGGRWVWSKEKFDEAYAKNQIIVNKTADGHSVRFKQYLKDENGIIRRGTQLSMITDIFNQEGTKIFSSLLGDKRIFDFPKPVELILKLMKWQVNEQSYESGIYLDFFSGSATTAHAVMQLNAEDGGNRKFIMVQLPEKTDEKSEAYKAGYKNICEIGKERIRRAGKKIKEEAGLMGQSLDTGFRVLKLDESNMADVYYTPANTPVQQTLAFDALVDNIREGRTAEDLLFQVMPECNLPLSSKIEEREIHGKKVFVVNDGYLIACFDSDINETVITAIAKEKPYYFIMCDRSIATDNVADNFDQIFNAYSKETIRRIL